MKIPNRQEFQKIAFNHSSDIDFKDFMNLYKYFTAKPYSFLAINTTFASDNPSHFRENLLKRMQQLIMTVDDKIRDEELQYDIDREEAKISSLSSAKIDKYEYLTDEEILPPNQMKIIEQAQFACSFLEKTFEKQTKKQVRAIKSLKHSNKKDELKQIEVVFPQNMMNDLIHVKSKETVNLQDIQTDNLRYKPKMRKA